jgi:hypothetical protein
VWRYEWGSRRELVVEAVCGANPEYVVAKVLAPDRGYRAAV